MRMRSIAPRRALAGEFLAAVVLSGCSAASKPRPEPAAAPTARPTTTSSASPRASPAATYLRWEKVRVWHTNGPTVDAVVGSELVISSPLGPVNGHVAEVTTIDGKPRLRHYIGGDTWHSQQHWIDDDLIGFVDDSLEEHRVRLTLMRPLGAAAPTAATSGVSPEADLSHGRVGYLTGDPSKRMCVHVVAPLTSNEIAWQHCGRTGEMLGDVALFEDRLSYTTVTDWTSPKDAANAWSSWISSPARPWMPRPKRPTRWRTVTPGAGCPSTAVSRSTSPTPTPATSARATSTSSPPAGR